MAKLPPKLNFERAKARKKRNRPVLKPPLPMVEQLRTDVDRLRPFAKQLHEDYERAAAEAAEMVKARKVLDRARESAPAPSAPTPATAPPATTALAPLRWVEDEVKLLKTQGVAYAGIGKHKLARELVGRMRTAVKAGLVSRLWSVGHTANELSDRGLWPVH